MSTNSQVALRCRLLHLRGVGRWSSQAGRWREIFYLFLLLPISVKYCVYRERRPFSGRQPVMVVRVAVVEWMVVDVVTRTLSVVVVVVEVVVVVVVDTERQVAGVAADDVAAVGGVGRHGRVQKCRMESKIVTFVVEKLHIGPQHVLRHGVWVASRLHYSVYPPDKCKSPVNSLRTASTRASNFV